MAIKWLIERTCYPKINTYSIEMFFQNYANINNYVDVRFVDIYIIKNIYFRVSLY